MLVLAEAAEQLLVAADIQVFWPNDLQREGDELVPPAHERFAILWPLGITPYANWCGNAYGNASLEISAGGVSYYDAAQVRDAVINALAGSRVRYVRSMTPVSSNRSGRNVVVVPVLFTGITNP